MAECKTTETFASRSVLATVEERLAPQRAALIVVDMQNDFCAPGGYVEGIGKDVSGLATIVPALNVLLASARSAGVPVIWLTACYEEDAIPPSMIAQKRRIGTSLICCERGSWGAGFFGVSPEPGEPVFEKHTYSGFSNPGLEQHLRALDREALIFAGVQTNVCVESTLREAHSRGFDVVIVQDAVASHAAKQHQATLANVGFLFGDVVTAEAIERAWAASPAGAGAVQAHSQITDALMPSGAR
ncbi:ureidoacrylate peracid hydrolase [Bosea sp. CRIB-10]|uniref:cysteine hydrolase family protein n=1 Tax=Bosea sp. CRIB-10 TaxID=378404 RepID=UPI0008E9AB6D|nr:isochorismatase family cysteine hydrolase [Bosea sp. CRIB-10]SFD67291.1 ureidoacrylate peracid hydrolase [Bosea sp. CRIB-10]